jgi:hypothetical protein
MLSDTSKKNSKILFCNKCKGNIWLLAWKDKNDGSIWQSVSDTEFILNSYQWIVQTF